MVLCTFWVEHWIKNSVDLYCSLCVWKYNIIRETLLSSPFTGWCNRQRKLTAPMLASVVAEATSAKSAEGATAPSPDEEDGEAREVMT